MALYDSNSGFVDGQRPDDSYNVTNPQANAPRPSMRAAAFRKNLDMQGRPIDLNNMPAEATQIANPRSAGIQFDGGATNAEEDMIRKDVYQKAQNAGSLDPATGAAKRAPMRGYNHTTGEYFEMAPSGERFGSDKVAEWTRRITAQNKDAAAIEEAKTARTDSRAKDERTFKRQEALDADALLDSASNRKYRAMAGDDLVAGRAFDRERATRADERSAAGDPVNRMIAGATAAAGLTSPGAQDAVMGAVGIPIDQEARKTERQAKAVAQMGEMLKDNNALPLQGTIGDVISTISSKNRMWYSKGSAASDPDIIRVAGVIDGLARQLAQRIPGLDFATAKAGIAEQFSAGISATQTPFRNEIMAALRGAGTAPAAPVAGVN